MANEGRDTGYTVEDLEKWIEKAEQNKARLQQGIDREDAAIDHAQRIIADLKARAEDVVPQ